MNRVRAVIREGFVTALTQPVASLVSFAIVAGMVAAVLLTTGRTVGSEQAVLGSIDSAGTRAIVVRAEPASGLDATVVDRLRNVDGIEWVGALGAAQDVTNTAIPGATKVPARLLWGDGFAALGVGRAPLADRSAWASPSALDLLGLENPAGGIETVAGREFAVVGEAKVPDYLTFLEPLVVVPQTSTATEGSVAVLVVIADRPDLVAPLSNVVISVLGVDDPTKVSVSTSEQLASLRSLIEGQLGFFGRGLVLAILGLSAVLVATILCGAVMLRRKDFGRRRALGSSRGLIVALLLAQVGLVSVGAVVTGTVVSLVALAISGDPLPDLPFIAAVDVLSLAVALVASLAPAGYAARRDPITELRVP